MAKRVMSPLWPIRRAATTGPTPYSSVTVVPEAATAVTMRALEVAISASRRLMSATKPSANRQSDTDVCVTSKGVLAQLRVGRSAGVRLDRLSTSITGSQLHAATASSTPVPSLLQSL